MKKRVLRACGAIEKERIARVIHKLKVPVHAFVITVGLLEAKNAQGTSLSGVSWAHVAGKRRT